MRLRRQVRISWKSKWFVRLLIPYADYPTSLCVSLSFSCQILVDATVFYQWLLTSVLVGGKMTTLKGEDIDYSGEPLNKAGLMASVNVDHNALLQNLPKLDPDEHWEIHTEPLVSLSRRFCWTVAMEGRRPFADPMDWGPLTNRHGCQWELTTMAGAVSLKTHWWTRTCS